MKHRSPTDPLTRLLRRVEIDPDTECWVWQGSLTSNGYGAIGVTTSFRCTTRAVTHRLVYERVIGPVAEGLELDHLCRNRRCCNPEHLEPVTHLENMRRSANARHSFEPAFIAELVDDYAAGMTITAIAEAREMPYSAVHERLLRAGVKPRRSGWQ